MITDQKLRQGFDNPALDSQKVFRAILRAMSRPGTIVDFDIVIAPPPPLDPATAAAALCLLDFETPLWSDLADSSLGLNWLKFYCGTAIHKKPEQASFALVTAPSVMPPLADFKSGSDEYPDQSATLIIQVENFSSGTPWILSGPGIQDKAALAISGLPAAFPEWLEENHALFPRGVDLIFTSGFQAAALPRSTRLER